MPCKGKFRKDKYNCTKKKAKLTRQVCGMSRVDVHILKSLIINDVFLEVFSRFVVITSMSSPFNASFNLIVTYSYIQQNL